MLFLSSELVEIETSFLFKSTVVFYYDFFLTLSQEIIHLWSFKLKLVNVLVIALRYITLFGYIPVLVLIFAPEIETGIGET